MRARSKISACSQQKLWVVVVGGLRLRGGCWLYMVVVGCIWWLLVVLLVCLCLLLVSCVSYLEQGVFVVFEALFFGCDEKNVVESVAE